LSKGNIGVKKFVEVQEVTIEVEEEIGSLLKLFHTFSMDLVPLAQNVSMPKSVIKSTNDREK